jgi:hypothetical protein
MARVISPRVLHIFSQPPIANDLCDNCAAIRTMIDRRGISIWPTHLGTLHSEAIIRKGLSSIQTQCPSTNLAMVSPNDEIHGACEACSCPTLACMRYLLFMHVYVARLASWQGRPLSLVYVAGGTADSRLSGPATHETPTPKGQISCSRELP